VTVTNNNQIYGRKVPDMAGYLCISFRTEKGKWAASFFKYGVKQGTETAWELDIITCVTKPCCT
jgi:hypothetical protein